MERMNAEAVVPNINVPSLDAFLTFYEAASATIAYIPLKERAYSFPIILPPSLPFQASTALPFPLRFTVITTPPTSTTSPSPPLSPLVAAAGQSFHISHPSEYLPPPPYSRLNTTIAATLTACSISATSISSTPVETCSAISSRRG